MGAGWMLLLLLGWLGSARVGGNSLASVCQSAAYRSLPAELQNEHQCMVLERLQTDLQTDKSTRDRHYGDIRTAINRLVTKMERGFQKVVSGEPRSKKARGFPALLDIPNARDCNELLMAGVNVSGVYPIRLPTGYVINVWCDMDTDYGGWTVVQRRQDGSVNFTRDWNAYTGGFGNVNTEFYLGNDNIHRLTTTMRYSLRIDFWDWEGGEAYALYKLFQLDSEEDKFRLHVEGFEGTAGDSLSYHNEMAFSTPGRDNDLWYANCAQKDRSGWWFRACSYSSLNGIFHPDGQQDVTPDGVVTGITWFKWKRNPAYSMRRVEMKIKPLTAIMAAEEGEQRRRLSTTPPATTSPAGGPRDDQVEEVEEIE